MEISKRNALRYAAVIVLTAIILGTTPCLTAQSSGSSTANASTTTPSEVVDQLLSMVEHEMVPLVEAMPADKFGFAPTHGNFQGVRTFGQQVQHVIQANYAMFGRAASMHPKMPANDQLKTKAQLVSGLKDSFAFAHKAIATLDQQNALDTIKPMDGISTRAGLMVFAIVHMNDHFGQLVEYLRMNGIVPPSSRHM